MATKKIRWDYGGEDNVHWIRERKEGGKKKREWGGKRGHDSRGKPILISHAVGRKEKTGREI